METSLLYRLRKRESNRCYNQCFPEKSYIDDVLLKRLQLEKELEGHSGCVNCLDWNTSGSLLASGSDDTNIIIWNPYSYKAHKTIQTGHRGNIFSVKFFPHTRDHFIASGAADCNVYIHDVTYNEKIHGFTCNSRVKRLVCTTEAPHNLWSASEDGIVREFDIREPSQKCSKVLIDLTKMCGDNAECKCLALNPMHPHMLAVGANDPYVRLYDRRMIKQQDSITSNGQKRKDNMHYIIDGCAAYFIPGHLHHKQKEYRRRMRYLCATYLTFNFKGNELLVNVGGEQVYLYNLNNKHHSLYQQFQQNSIKKSVNGCSGHNESFSSNQYDYLFKLDETIVDQEELDKLSPDLEVLKIEANKLFHKKEYTRAIMLYNKALLKAPKAAVMFGNRAAAYLKRAWDGDVYAALRDCYSALSINPSYAKASYRLTKCLYELRWLKEAKLCLKAFKSKHPTYAEQPICTDLERDIKSAIKSSAKQNTDETLSIDESEIRLQRNAFDYSIRYCGHCNTTTDIKEANFFGNDGQFIIAGSDDGSFFVWERKTSNLVHVMHADDSIVNCLQPHPFTCLLASSGIDPYVRLWSPSGNVASDRIVKETETAAAANQQRMNTDPFESMLISMGMRGSMPYEVVEGQDVLPCQTS